MTYPWIDPDSVPFVTVEQMREVDRLMTEEYGIHLLQMMEAAGRHLADLARHRFLSSAPAGKRVLVLAGTGGNGGGGLVCARRLHSWGAAVTVFVTSRPDRFTDVPRRHLSTLQRLGVPIHVAEESETVLLPPADLIVDAVIGYSLRGAPAGAAAALIRGANNHGAPVLSLDVPSGVGAGTGVVHDPSVRATATLTLALPKRGFRVPEARLHVGELYLGDIGVPPQLYGEPSLGLLVTPPFGPHDLVRLW